jgi:hypothetical protein
MRPWFMLSVFSKLSEDCLVALRLINIQVSLLNVIICITGITISLALIDHYTQRIYFMLLNSSEETNHLLSKNC